jgi:valyl-tRNA synthetase
METGHDILFFWVARMIMMGLWFTDKPPFHTVYLHGLIRDKYGRKISKTLGNTIDPLDIIAKYGTDPLRFTLITSGTPGNDVNLDTDKVEYNFKFINKIWNITKLVKMNLESDLQTGLPAKSSLDLPARWILSRMTKMIQSVQYLFDIYQYGEAGNQILSFMWDEFAPWYLEMAKHPLYNGTNEQKDATRRVMVAVLDTCLRLLHPYMPFMTEEAWSYIPHTEDALIIAKWPQADESLLDEAAENDMTIVMELVRNIRNIRKDYNVDPAKRIQALIQGGTHTELMQDYAYVFGRLCNVADAKLLDTDAPAPANSAVAVVADVSLYLPLEDMMDLKQECARLNKEKTGLSEQIAKLQDKLGNEGFVAKAPAQVVQKERERLAEYEASVAQINERLAALCG